MLNTLKKIFFATGLGTLLGALFGFVIPLIYVVAFDIIGSIVMQDYRFNDEPLVSFFRESFLFIMPMAIGFAQAGSIVGGVLSFSTWQFAFWFNKTNKLARIGLILGLISGYIPEFLHFLTNEYYIFDGVTILKLCVFMGGGSLAGWIIGKTIEKLNLGSSLELV